MPRLHLIGAGTPTPTKDRWGTCFVLDIVGQRFMIDCGPASTYKLFHAGIASTDVDNLFFTHLHSDHIADYPCFLMTRFDQSVGEENVLNVYGPSPVRDLHERLWSPERGVFWYDVRARVNHPMSIHAYHSRGGEGDRPEPVVSVKEYGEGVVASGPGWSCSAMEVRHAQPWLNCFGFRFETDEGIVSFTGDSAPCDSVVELSRNADLTVIESVHRARDIARYPSRISETGTTDAGRMADKAKAKRLVINHQSDRLDPPDAMTEGVADVKSAYGGPVWWGKDGMVIDWD